MCYSVLQLKVNGPVSQTGLSLNQDKALVKLRYLSSFYKNDFEENIKVCILTQNNDTDIF